MHGKLVCLKRMTSPVHLENPRADCALHRPVARQESVLCAGPVPTCQPGTGTPVLRGTSSHPPAARL
ncbi:hypothetical protein AAFF_G00185100 [Aldrovandia affinis]|uniref:Uncharacterized protein n=1 Tax=Aldrovandia affinis TaxID=143900 RepID=A0AAD7W620_9TELE|nr:hypothetical protein AAFF_G00185100 [Aldrovandia affinis]